MTTENDTGLREGKAVPVRRVRHVLLEAVCVVLIALVGGMLVFQTALLPYGDQLEARFRVVIAAFRAPAMFALGHGMRDYDVASVPALNDFYRGKVASVNPSSVPSDIKTFPVNDSYGLMHYSLMYAIGWAWRLLGVSTWSVHVLCAVLYAALVAVMYGLFRLAMGRVMSLVIVLFLSTSPAYLFSCPSLRDFGKAPFMLGFLLIAGILLTRRQTARSLVAWSLVMGVVTGVGYGFRQDLLTCLPAAMTVILVFARVEGKRIFRWRVLAAVCTLFVFVLTGWMPISGTLKDNGSASAQALVQGSSESAEARMDFGRASYVALYEYPDLYDFTVVNAYARRQGDQEPMPGQFTPAHGRMGKRWFREELREYPADLFSRGIASALTVPKIASISLRELERDPVPNRASIERFLPFHKALAEHFALWGVWYIVAGLALFAFYDLRAATGAGLLLIYFASLPGLLFEFRHFFHLAFVPYWVVAAMAAWAGRLCWRVVRRKRPFLRGNTSGWAMPGRLAGAILLPLALVSGLALVLGGLWQIQTVTLSRLLSQYGRATMEPVPVREEVGDHDTLLRPESPLPGLAQTDKLAAFESCGDYLVLDMDYDGQPIRMRVVYEGASQWAFTHRIEPHIAYPGHPCRIHYFVPVYQTTWPEGTGVSWNRFAGVEVEKGKRNAIHGVYRVSNANEFVLWPFMTVPEERETFVDHKSGPHDRAFSALTSRLGACVFGVPGACSASGGANGHGSGSN